MCISVSSPYAEEAIEPSELKLPLILATPEETVLRRLDIAEDTVDLMLLKAEVVVDFSVFQPLVTVLRTADTEEVVRLLISLWTKANKPTAGRTKAIHRRLELSFNLYLLLLFVGQNRASKSLLHITPRIFRFLQFFNK